MGLKRKALFALPLLLCALPPVMLHDGFRYKSKALQTKHSHQIVFIGGYGRDTIFFRYQIQQKIGLNRSFNANTHINLSCDVFLT